MKQAVKIVVIGAGSKEFSRGLVNDIVLTRELHEARKVSLCLVDIAEKNLKLMEGYARRCAQTMGVEMEVSATTERTEALPGADFVLLSVAVQRMPLWEQDFRVPLSLGIQHIYGENGGPGAAFHALRNLAIIMPICRDIEALCPNAFVMNFTNPEARILTGILSLTRLKAVGLCHGFYDFQSLVSRVLERPRAELATTTAGMNHFYTCLGIRDRRDGRDLLPLFTERLRANPSVLPPLVRHLWEAFDVIGYCSDHHVGEYVGYAHELVGLQWEFGIEKRTVLRNETAIDGWTVFDAWRHHVDVGAFLDKRLGDEERAIVEGTRPLRPDDVRISGELAVPIIADILLDRGAEREAVNVLNTGGFIENLARDGCIEVPAVVDAAGIHPRKVGSLPEAFAAMIRQQHAIQKLVVQAYAQRSRKLLLQALLLDPVVKSASSAERLLETMLRLQAEYLPELK